MKKAITIILLLLAITLLITACVQENPNTSSSTTTENSQVEDPPVKDSSEVKEIKLSGAKSSFAFAENFSSEDLVVTLIMTDGTEKTLAKNEYTVSSENYDSMKVGTYEVTVKIKDTELSQSYDVTVAPANKLKVLMIGNSFADDTINYAYEIAKNSGIPEENILIADIYIGGCSIDTHWNNAQTNAAAYRFGLEKEGWFDGSSYTNWTMEQAIMYADWDFITFQQNSGNSGNPNTYSNLQNLMDYVWDIATDEINNPNANPNVKFVWHQTWAYAQNTTNSAFQYYSNSQTVMYNSIISSMKLAVLNKDFAAIIPNGTAIQNSRTSTIGDTLTRDQYDHLSHDAGRYIAAMGLVGTLTGRDMTQITWTPEDSGFNYPMSQEMIDICKESWANAMSNPFVITASKYRPESIFDVFEGSGTQDDPFLIQSAEDMIKLSEITYGKSHGDSTMYFKLTADIDLSAENWTPICSSSPSGWVSSANSFNANFDGNGKSITFVGNYTGDVWAKGLFSAVGGHVHDLTLYGTINIEKGRVGSLASMAMAGAKIENITSYVNITAGNNQVGGIVGYVATNDVTFINCKNYGTITGRELVGGILGGGWTNITYIGCENHGDITATTARAGGISGEKFAVATLTNCTNEGTIIAGGKEATANYGEAENYAGYLAGIEE